VRGGRNVAAVSGKPAYINNIENKTVIQGTFLGALDVGGSGWEDVYRILKKDGYRVSIVQSPTTSLVDDVAATKRVIAEQQGP
jgi:hypothetical protein